MCDFLSRRFSRRPPLLHAGAERYAAPPRAFPCVSLRFINILTKSWKWPNPPDKTRHFQTSIWVKWEISSSLLPQYRYFAIQSLNTPPTPPRHFQTFYQQPRAIKEASPAITMICAKNISYQTLINQARQPTPWNGDPTAGPGTTNHGRTPIRWHLGSPAPAGMIHLQNKEPVL